MNKILKKNKSLIIAGLVLIAFILAYFKRESIKAFFSKSKPSSPATIAANPTPTISSNTVNNDSLLSKGSSGQQVRRLQELLNIKHGNNKPQIIPYLVEDGKFGAATETMLKKWTGKTSITINQLIKALK